jgi:hypothetical protein
MKSHYNNTSEHIYYDMLATCCALHHRFTFMILGCRGVGSWDDDDDNDDNADADNINNDNDFDNDDDDDAGPALLVLMMMTPKTMMMLDQHCWCL